MASIGKHVVFIVENCSVPFDPRVWKEAISVRKLGFDVSIISPKGYKRDTINFEKVEGINIYRYQLPIDNYSKPGYIIEYLKAFIFTSFFIFKIHLKKKIHVIHVANPPDIFFIIGFFARIFNLKFIFDHHDLSPESYKVKFNKKNDYLYRIMLLMEYFSVKVSNCVITTNESLKKIVINRCKVKSEKVVVVRNGPNQFFRDKRNLKKYKKPSKYIATYFGIMGQADGVENIIYAADYICNQKKVENIKFVLIGNGDQFLNLNRLTSEKGLRDKVLFTDRIPFDQVKSIISASDICLAPDPRNGLNEFHTMNKIADYMAYSKPIISFDLDETRYTAADSAIYVKGNNPKKFGDAIIDLIDNKDKRDRMGSIGYKRLEERFTWEHSEINLKKVYFSLLNLKSND